MSGIRRSTRKEPVSGEQGNRLLRLTRASRWSPLVYSVGLWLDASDATTITLVSSAVSQWNDKSGNGRNATQSTSTKRPVVTAAAQNGRDVITFDATDDGMVTSYTVNRNYTIAFVGMQTGTAQRRLINSSTQNRVLSIRRASEPVFLGSNVVDSGYGTNNVYVVGVLNVSTSATTTYHYNGTNIARVSPGSADWGTLTLGAEGVFAEAAAGALAELLVFPSALAAAAREEVEGYLAHKWGLAGDLPGGHPYKGTPP